MAKKRQEKIQEIDSDSYFELKKSLYDQLSPAEINTIEIQAVIELLFQKGVLSRQEVADRLVGYVDGLPDFVKKGPGDGVLKSTKRSTTDIHREAMALADEAMLKKVSHPEESRRLFRRSFEKEKEAALSLKNNSTEPSRSVLFRSAASLAFFDCGEAEEAQSLIAEGLRGAPSPEIAEELLDIRKKIEENEKKP